METKIIAIVNRKGGSAKTTTAFNLAGVFAERGQRVLVVDLDPQGSLSRSGFGVGPGNPTLSQVLERRGEGFASLVQATTLRPGLVAVAPADRGLNALDKGLGEIVGRELLLKGCLAKLEQVCAAVGDRQPFDWILIDTPPTLGYMPVNALVAATHALLPADTSPAGLGALGETMRVVHEVQAVHNPQLKIAGVAICNVKPGTQFEKIVAEHLRGVYGADVLSTIVPHSVKIKESLAARQPYVVYDSHDRLSESGARFRALADEIAARCEGGAP